MAKHITGTQTAPLPLQVGQPQAVKIEKGQHLRVQDLQNGVLKDAANVVVTRKGSDLRVKFADGTEVVFENFYEQCQGDNGCSVTVGDSELGSFTIGASTPVGTELADGSELVHYSFADAASLMNMATQEGAFIKTQAAAAAGAGAAAASSVPTLGLVLGGLALAAAAGGGGSSGSAAPAPAPAPAPIPTFTLTEALAASSLPSTYNINPTAVLIVEQSVSVSEAQAGYASVQTILAGAANSASLNFAALVQFSLTDNVANLAAAEAALISAADAVTVTNTSLTGAQLNSLVGLTALNEQITATSLSFVSGSMANFNVLLAEVTLPANFTATVESNNVGAGSVISLMNATGTGVVNLAAVAGMTGTAAQFRQIYESTQVSIGTNVTLTLSPSTAAAADLIAIDAFTTRAIDAQAMTTLTGNVADVLAVYDASQLASPTIILDGDYAVTVTGNLSVGQANTLRADTTGLITATISSGTATTLLALEPGSNAYSLTVTGTASVEQLLDIDALTSVLVNATGVTTITGTAAELVGLINIEVSAGGRVDISDTFNATVANDTVPTSAAHLVALDAFNTTGAVDATAVTAITGTLEDVTTVIVTNNTSITHSASVALTVTGSGLATTLSALDAQTSALINATGMTEITGSLAELNALVVADTGNAVNVGSVSIVLTGTTTATATQLLALDEKFTGVVNMTGVTRVTGTPSQAAELLEAFNAGRIVLNTSTEFDLSSGVATVEEVNALRAIAAQDVEITAVIQESDAATLLTLTGTDAVNNYDISVTGPTSAENLLTIAAKTSVVVDATGVLNMSAANAVNARAVFDATDINTNPAVAVSIPAGNYSAADLNTISAATSGVLNITGQFSTTTITGTATEVATLVADAGITFAAANDATYGRVYNVTGAATATQLIAINTAAAKVVNATGVTGITGSATDLLTVTAYDSSTGMNLSVGYTLNVTGNTSVANANTLDGRTSGLITATISPVTITSAKTLTAIQAPNAYTIVLTDDADEFLAADLNAINALTTVKVDAQGLVDGSAGDNNDTIAQIRGTGADWGVLISAVEADTIDLPTNFAAVVTGDVNATVLSRIDAQTESVVQATGITSIIGTAAEVAAVVAVDGVAQRLDISTTYAVAVQNADTATEALDLVNIDAHTTGVVNATAVTSITGTVSQLNTVVVTNKTAGTTTLADNVGLTVTGTGSALVLAAINGATTATVDATAVTDITSSAYADIWAQVHNNAGITFSNAFTATVSDAQTVANLNALSAKTSGAITATVSNTSIADLLGLLETNNVYAVAPVGSASVSQLLELNGKTAGIVSLAGLTTITGTSDELASFLTSLPAGFNTDLPADIAVTVIDSSRIATVTELNAINAATTGVVNATAVTRISGTAAELIALDLVSTAEMTTSATYTATVFGTATAAQLNTINTQAGAVIATGVTAITGGTFDLDDGVSTSDYEVLIAALDASLVANRITLSTGTPIVVSSALTVAEANTLNARAEFGTITATIVSGTAATLVGLNGTGNAYTLTVTDAATTVADLLNLDSKTTVLVDATAVTTSITGSGAEWANLMAAHVTNPVQTINLAGNYNGIITGEVSWATVGLVNADTNVTVKMDGVTTITGSGAVDVINLMDAGLLFLNSSVTTVLGGAGADIITSSIGQDIIIGGAGADVITLSTNLGTLSGGRDVVRVGTVAVDAIDTINNFNAEYNVNTVPTDDRIGFFNSSFYLNMKQDGDLVGYGTLDRVLNEVVAQAVADANNGTTVGGAAGFIYDGVQYLFIDGGNNGYSTGDDAVVRLTEIVGGANFTTTQNIIDTLTAANFIA